MNHRPRIAALMVLVLAVAGLAQPCVAPQRSELWGVAGELWNATGRLPDFSHAGYHEGEAPLPEIEPAADVTDFGAKGDGEHDDTQAFLDALAATERGAILVPPGRYRITRILEITRPGVVLRGAGPERSVLFLPTPLNEIKPSWGETTGGRRTSNYSWSGGLVWMKGGYGSKTLATVTAPARRGDTALLVSTTEGLEPGQRVEIYLTDDDEKSLTRHLYSGDPGDISKFPGARESLVVRLVEVTESTIRFDRPLRCDVELAWKPEIRSHAPTVTECGIEHLGFEFPLTPYGGHFTEVGFNAIALSGVADCWVRDIVIQNADSGIFVSARFCTLTGVTYRSDRKTSRDTTGHHGVILGGNDNLFTRFRFDTRFVHDLGVTVNNAGNVFSAGSGVDLNLDHHRRAPHDNLFTDLDAGRGTRLWSSGGGQSLGLHCGARGTFWNIRTERPLKYPPPGFGPASMNLVGVATDQPSILEPGGRWFEALAPVVIDPPDLHRAQLARRLAAGR